MDMWMHMDTVVITLDAQQMDMLMNSDSFKIFVTRTVLMFKLLLLIVSVKLSIVPPMVVVNASDCFHMVNQLRLFLYESVEEGSFFMSLFTGVLSFFGGGEKNKYHTSILVILFI